VPVHDVADHAQLLAPVRLAQPQVRAHHVQIGALPRHVQHAVQHAARLEAGNRQVVVLVVQHRITRHHRVAVVQPFGHGIAAVGVLMPDLVGQEFVLRGARATAAIDFLQKHHVAAHGAHGFPQLVQHEPGVEDVITLVDVHGQYLHTAC